MAEEKKSKWDQLSGRMQLLIILGCIVGFIGLLVGVCSIFETPAEARARAREWEAHVSAEEARMGAKEDAVRVAPTGWIRVKSYDFVDRCWWFDKVDMWVSTDGVLEHREFYLIYTVIHESDTLKHPYLAFEEKLKWELRNNWEMTNRLVWKDHPPSEKGRVHLFLPSDP